VAGMQTLTSMSLRNAPTIYVSVNIKVVTMFFKAGYVILKHSITAYKSKSFSGENFVACSLSAVPNILMYLFVIVNSECRNNRCNVNASIPFLIHITANVCRKEWALTRIPKFMIWPNRLKNVLTLSGCICLLLRFGNTKPRLPKCCSQKILYSESSLINLVG